MADAAIARRDLVYDLPEPREETPFEEKQRRFKTALADLEDLMGKVYIDAEQFADPDCEDAADYGKTVKDVDDLLYHISRFVQLVHDEQQFPLPGFIALLCPSLAKKKAG